MKRYLVLSDGNIYEGRAIGADSGTVGELVFTTGMCGYIETLTDPSYYGQIVLQTFPLIGNYGIIEQDFEGKTSVNGYVVNNCCNSPSNFRTDYTLDEFLKKNNICGICDVDTREITKHIRNNGVCNAIITDTPDININSINNYMIESAVSHVTGDKTITEYPDEEKYRVVLMDFGAKRNIARSLLSRGCVVITVPANTTAKEILEYKPDGVMLSNGPGDPSENTEIIKEIKKLFNKVPIFGICLGHQLMALSQGASAIKLKYGHRGVNQPVKDIKGTRTYITSQNHGYAVDATTLKNGSIRYINANDGTVEGIDYSTESAFSVQFHPEACSGPRDTEFLFDRFCDLMSKERN